MESTADTQRQQQLLKTKVPKLRYRNAPIPLSPFAVHCNSPDASQTSSPLPPQSPSVSTSISSSTLSPTLSPTSAQSSSFYASSVSTASISSDSLTVPPSPYTEPSRRTKSKAAKNKMTSLLGFFTIKEPSQQAWADYQTTIKKQQTNHRSRSPNVGVPMVSSARLPSHVPAVNSKWDGIPEGTKEQRESNPKERRESSTSKTPDRDSRSHSLSLHSSRKNSGSIPRRSSAQHSHRSQYSEAAMPRFSLQTVNDALNKSALRSVSPFKALSRKTSHASLDPLPTNPLTSNPSTTSPLPAGQPPTSAPSMQEDLDPLHQPITPDPAPCTTSGASPSPTSSVSATTFTCSSSKPFPPPLPIPPRSPHKNTLNPPSPSLPNIQIYQPLPNSPEVIVSTKGPNVLPPPFSPGRGRSPNRHVDSLGIPSVLNGPTQSLPPSILKKSTPGRMGMHHIQLPRDPMHPRDMLIAPWPSPGENGQFDFT